MTSLLRVFFAVLIPSLIVPARAITITGYTANASNRWSSAPTDPVLGPFTPNTNVAFVGLGYDFSGVGWKSTNTSSYNDLAVTLVSPRHMAQAIHVGDRYSNNTFTFQNTDGVMVSRSITGTAVMTDLAPTDARLIKLDTAFTPADKVSFYRLLDTGATSGAIGLYTLVYGHNNNAEFQRRIGRSTITSMQEGGSNPYSKMLGDTVTSNFVNTYVTGDSGSPTFITYNNALLFQGPHYGIGSSNNWDTNWTHSSIYPGMNAAMAADGYALRWTIHIPNARTWTGGTDGTFGTATNWASLNQPSEFTPAALDGAATTNRNINLVSAAPLRGMLIRSAAGVNPFTFTGSTLTLGTTGLRNEDADTLTINNPITLGGSQNWEAANGPITLGADIATAGFLVVLSGDQPITLSGNLTGTGSVAWDNPGTWTPTAAQLGLSGKLFVQRGTVNLTGANTYTGGTVATGGTLLANNTTGSATGSGTVSISQTAKLGGSGTISGAVTFSNGGGLLADLITAPGAHDRLDITGALALGTSSTLTITANGSATAGTYTLITAAGGITGSLPALTLPANWSATVQISGNNLNLIVTSTILSTPVITAGQRATVTVNTALSYPILATQTPTSYALATGSLPSGITLNTTTGILSGTPSQAGTYAVAFTATNAAGISTATALTLQVAPVTTAIISESFNYALGSTNPDPDAGLNSNNGLPATNSGGNPSGTSTGLSGTHGTDQALVAGLSYSDSAGDLVSSANALRRNTGTGFSLSAASVYKSMVTDPYASYRSTANTAYLGWNGTSATQLYFSVLLNVNALNTGTDNRLVIELGKDNVSWKLYPGQYNGTSQWRYGDGDGTQASLGTAVANQTVLLVGRISCNSATNSVVDVWLNPALGQALGTPTYSKTITTTTSGVQFRGIQTRDGANVLTYDEFRMGTTFASVTPYTQLIPAAPSGLVATATSSTQMSLAWTDNASNETGFKLERSPDGSTGWTQIATPAANAASYSDTGLSAGTIYHYRLRATNAAGDSAYTATASASTQTGVQAFRATYGLAANGSQDTATPAGDGVPNLLKYAFNMLGSDTGQAATLATPNASVLDPVGSAGLPYVSLLSAPSSSLQITYLRRKASTSPGITYAVEFTDDLVTWAVNPSATESVTSLDATFERVTVTDSVATPSKRFTRVKVTAP